MVRWWTLNYYYMGWFVLAVPIRLLGFGPDVGFNLGVATYAALAAVTVFSTSAMLVELARRRSDKPLSPEATGLFATLIFLVIGNLDGFRQVINRLRSGLPLSEFDWWDPSRVNKSVIWDVNRLSDPLFTPTCGGPDLTPCGFEVTEFPSFTVLFADLHPHFMAMPFFGLGLAGCIAFIERARQGKAIATWVLAFGLGIGSGFMRMVHTWDMPTFVVFVVGSIVLGWTMARGPVWWRARFAVGQLVLAGVAHMAVTAPYRANNQVAESGFSRSESVTNLDDWLTHWGLFLFIGVSFMGVRVWGHRDRLTTEAAAIDDGDRRGRSTRVRRAWHFSGIGRCHVLCWAHGSVAAVVRRGGRAAAINAPRLCRCLSCPWVCCARRCGDLYARRRRCSAEHGLQVLVTGVASVRHRRRLWRIVAGRPAPASPHW